MSILRSRFATNFCASALVAGTLLGLGATTAAAAPATPATATQTQSSQVDQGAPEFWASKVNMTFLNNTDLTLHYQQDYQSPKHVIKPGDSFYISNGESGVGILAHTADKGMWVSVSAGNPEMGFPTAHARISIGGKDSEGKQTHSVNEHRELVSTDGLAVSSYRHADSNGKNFTLTLTKSSSAAATVDNTASARNTYVYTNGTMTPIHKGSTGAASALERGKDATVQVMNGGAITEMRVTWQAHQATFTGVGKSATLANGESATFGQVTVTRADTNHGATTAYTYTVR